jgi:RNA polymerase sigma-70 factor (ECF subfamily)
MAEGVNPTRSQPERVPPAAAEAGRAGAAFPRALLERLREREPEALGRFYDVYFDRVYGYVKRMVGEEHLAEDLTQDIFMHIHRSFDTYDPARDLRPWVFTIATNKVRDYWRSRRHRDGRLEASLDDETAADPVSTERGPIARLFDAELGRTLSEAIDDLPEAMRQTLVLRYFEGLSFADIARLVDRNEAAVRKRYSRALEELRRRLAPHVGLEGGTA